MWYLSTDQAAGAQPRVVPLPPEMGGGMLSRGIIKTGISGMAALRGIPRPDTIGQILYGLCGNVVSVNVDADEDGCHAAIALTGAPQDITTGITDPTFARRLTIKGTKAGATLTGDVVITGTGADCAALEETIALNGDAVVSGIEYFKTVTNINVPAYVTDGDTVAVGFWGDGSYQHTFKIGADPADVPYFTMRRRVAQSFGEQVDDCKFASLAMDMAAINYVTGEFAAAGITPTLVDDVSSWSPAPDSSAPFVACTGAVALETGDTPTTLPVRAANLTIANAQAIDENFIIGQYTPRDIDVVGRVVALEYVVLVTGADLYGELMYDPAGGTDWLPDVFDTAAVQHLTFKSAENIPGTSSPYELTLAGAAAQWAATPIGMRGQGNVMVRVAGNIVQPGSGDPITLVLKNNVASY
jgi:hypothetical protein